VALFFPFLFLGNFFFVFSLYLPLSLFSHNITWDFFFFPSLEKFLPREFVHVPFCSDCSSLCTSDSDQGAPLKQIREGGTSCFQFLRFPAADNPPEVLETDAILLKPLPPFFLSYIPPFPLERFSATPFPLEEK